MAVRDIVQAAAGVGGAEPVYVEDVFSTTLYTGNGKAQTINNGIALSQYDANEFTDFLGEASATAGLTATNTGGSSWYGSSWMRIPNYKCYFRVTESISNNFANIGLFSSTHDGFLQDAVKPFIAHRSSGSTFNSSAGGTPGGDWVLATTSIGVEYAEAGTQVYWDFAVDKPNGKAWIRVNGGAWIGGGDPAAGTSPTLYNAFDMNYLGAGTYQASQTFTMTAAGSLTPPTGFTAIGGRAVNGDITEYGGMVWLKNRSTTYDFGLFNTIRGVGKGLRSNLTGPEFDLPTTTLTAFNSNGFSVGDNPSFNNSGNNIVSWTFKKAKKFFDVVTYTGNGVAGRTISHNLGSVPGCVIIKRTSDDSGWAVYHRSLDVANNESFQLNSSIASFTTEQYWNNTAPTSTTITLGTNATVNGNGSSYVAYIFAHDAGGFGEYGDQSIIACGGFTCDGSGNATIDLGWEPGWVLLKRRNATENWEIFDALRGWYVDSAGKRLRPSTSEADSESGETTITNTGFRRVAVAANATYVYVAIRRGPMKIPTTGTEVFAASAYSGLGSTPITITSNVNLAAGSSVFIKQRSAASANRTYDTLRGPFREIYTQVTNAEVNRTSIDAGLKTFNSNGFSLGTNNYNGTNESGQTYVAWQFKRAPGFHDVVCYTGFGSGSDTANIKHSLGVAPEMVIYKARNNTSQWVARGTFGFIVLNDSSGRLNSTPLPATSTTFQVSASANTSLSQYESGYTYVAYLFASCPGVSKIGTVSISNSGTLDVNCGFTGSARFVMLKRIDGISDWLLFDSARGIVAGDDPYLAFNVANAENFNGSNDNVDPYVTGFSIPMNTFSNLYGTGTYLYLAIA